MNSDNHLSRKKFHQCDICGYRTKSIPLIINHVRRHRNEITRNSQKVFICSNELDKYKCLQCDYQTPFKVNLKKHNCSSNRRNNIDFVKTYNCENCDFETSSYLVLGKHVHYDCKHVVNNCDLTLLSESENNDESLSERKFHRCDICLFYGTKSIPLITNHVQRHREIARNSQEVFNCSSELDKYKCLRCDFQTPFKVNLKRHVCSGNQQNQIDFVKTYNCENCDFQTSSCAVLLKHIYCDFKSVTKRDQKSESCGNGDENETIEIEWHCGYCFFKSETKRDLRKHIYRKHLPTEKNNMLNKSNNDDHTTKEIKWFKCANCTFQSKWKSHLKLHILSKHTPSEEIKWFKCANCSFQSKWKSHLKRHILLKHTAAEKIKFFKCANCTFQSKQISSLNTHILSKHTPSEEIKWFKCANCTFQSKLKSSLKRHILRKHMLKMK